MEEIRESNESPTLSYNYFLYQKRKEKGFSRRKFARYINVPIIRYRLVEQGYLKPSRKDILSISQQLNVDYNAYLEGFNGYPTEIPPKLQGKFAKKIFNLLGKTSLRIVALVFTVLFLFMFIGSQIAQSYYDKRPTFFYNETLVEFQNKIEEKGSPNFSLTGKFRYPQVAITDRDNINNTAILTQITSIYLKEEFKLGFIMVYWSDTYRYYLKLNEMIGTDGKYILDAYDYGTSTLYSGTYIDSGEGIIEFKSAPEDLINNFKAFISGININSKFDKVIKDKLNLDVDYINDIAVPYFECKTQEQNITSIVGILSILGLIFFAIFAFLSAYAFAYGNRNRVENIFHHGDELFGFSKMLKPIKKDIRFSPFLPETIIEFIGIAIVFVGSLRVVLYALTFASYSSESLALAKNFLSIQLLGMFLLYFIDFDLFMDDNRVLRNITMYALSFIMLYFFETMIMIALNQSESIIIKSINTFIIPNPFGSVACYYALMAFLFFTPKFIKTKKALIVYRCLGILPIIYIVVSFLISHGDILFGWDMSNLWLKNFFTTERFPFSMLAVLYIVGLFFLRLFYKKKYGEENAMRFFMGNRFIMLKNIFTAIIIVVVWGFELGFVGNVMLNNIGIGVNTRIIYLAPLLLFYHPHKGPRNVAIDITTLVLYFFSLLYAYLIALVIVGVSLI